MKLLFLCSFVLILFLLSPKAPAEPIYKIAFGSCLRQDRPQSIWDSIIDEKPDIFIFMGDNIYADTKNPNIIQKKYKLLADQPGYQRLSSTTPVYATWDDHDYGQNDAGEENPIKKQSEELFLDFFNIPKNSATRARPGVYQSYLFGPPEKRVQLILLDTRYFRGPTVKIRPTETCPRVNYGQQRNPETSILGRAQWDWLAGELVKPAKIRIIASSVQVIPDEHCWEKWSNFPLERQKLFDLIASTNANGVVFISGDRHLAEISKIELEKVGYPLYEITSSGMNTKMYGKGEKNQHRVSKDNFREHNYGIIEINWEDRSSELKLQIHNKSGKLLYMHEVLLSDLNVIAMHYH